MTSTASQTIDGGKLTRLEHMLDRQDILDCLTRVGRGMDRFDRQLFLSAYHPDAVIDAGQLVASPEAAYDNGAELHAHGQISTLHNLLSHTCEIDGNVAHCETYFLYTGRNRDETNWMAGGRYIDRLERREGQWKIALRCTVMEWSGVIPPAVVPLFDQVPNMHLNGIPSRSSEDISYRRPLTNRRAMSTPADVRALSAPRT